MIDMECPKCGRFGSVPNDKVNSRLVCKKCLAIFHLTPTGRAVVGEPPDHKYEEHAQAAAVARSQKKKESLDFGSFDMGRGGLLLGALGLGFIALIATYLFSGPPDHDFLEPQAQKLAQALAVDNLDYVKEASAEGSASDVNKWWEKVRPILAEMQRDSSTNELLSFVLVIEENTNTRTGLVDAAFRPEKGTSRAESIAIEASAKPSGRASLTLPIYWVMDEKGKWRVDGSKTLNAAASVH